MHTVTLRYAQTNCTVINTAHLLKFSPQNHILNIGDANFYLLQSIQYIISDRLSKERWHWSTVNQGHRQNLPDVKIRLLVELNDVVSYIARVSITTKQRVVRDYGAQKQPKVLTLRSPIINRWFANKRYSQMLGEIKAISKLVEGVFKDTLSSNYYA